jgi:hypothetical protein
MLKVKQCIAYEFTPIVVAADLQQTLQWCIMHHNKGGNYMEAT